jgi:predicted HTH domain antitoxin
MTLHLPDHLLQQYSEAEIRLEIALALFQREMMTLGQASQWAGLPQWQMQTQLKQRGIPLHYDVEEYQEDLRMVEELMKRL